MSSGVTAIIPTWCEAGTIVEAVLAARSVADEVVVVDAQSPDGTAARARSAGARVLAAAKGRGTQLDAGAREATGDVLLFLHADARLPAHARKAIDDALEEGDVLGGNFRLRFTPDGLWPALFSAVDDWRRRALSIYYGDSALFIRREVYQSLGGFREMPIMEDYDLVRRLERAGRTAYLRDVEVHVSARRFAGAPIRTLAIWALVQLLFSSGVSPSRLSRLYVDIR